MPSYIPCLTPCEECNSKRIISIILVLKGNWFINELAQFLNFIIILNICTLKDIILKGCWLYGYYRNSHLELFRQKGAFKNFAKFTGEQLCQSLFLINLLALRVTLLKKKGLWHRCFSVNFEEHLFYRTPLVAASVTDKKAKYQVIQNSGMVLCLFCFYLFSCASDWSNICSLPKSQLWILYIYFGFSVGFKQIRIYLDIQY